VYTDPFLAAAADKPTYTTPLSDLPLDRNRLVSHKATKPRSPQNVRDRIINCKQSTINPKAPLSALAIRQPLGS